MKARTHTRWIKGVALGIAVAAIAAPAAQGAYEPLYQHQFTSDGTPVVASGEISRPAPADNIVAQAPNFPMLDELQQFRFTPGEATHPFSFTPSNEPVGPTVVIPDPTRGLPSTDALQQFRFTPDPIVTPVASVPSGGVDWTDAGIGAGMALGAILLGAAAALGLRRRRLAHS